MNTIFFFKNFLLEKTQKETIESIFNFVFKNISYPKMTPNMVNKLKEILDTHDKELNELREYQNEQYQIGLERDFLE